MMSVTHKKLLIIYFMKVHSELNLSIISTQFYGILMKETQCYECFNIFYNFSFFEIITFDLSFYKNKNYFNIYNGFID